MLKTITASLVAVIILLACRGLSKEKYYIKEFRRHTGLRDHFQIEYSTRNDSLFVLKVKIDNSAVLQLEKQFYFIPYKYYIESITNLKREQDDLQKLHGFDVANDGYTYYLGSIPFTRGYFVICLSKKKDHLIFAETNK